MKQTADDLLAVAQYLLDHGWLQRDYGNDGGPRCIIGAFWSVSGLEPNAAEYPRPGAKLDRLQNFAAAVCQHELGLVVAFNDDPSTTFEMVINRLHEASRVASSDPVVSNEPALV